jgi:thioredoxin reductase
VTVTEQVPREQVDVAIVGAGPAGLAAATELARRKAGKVVVLDREPDPGGIPRHAHHQGYGLRDLHRVMSGPDYAVRWAELATASGADIRTRTQVTGWTDAAELELTGPNGRRRLAARAIVLATGCRERPRSARLVAGTRPQGVMTTGMLQQLVYLRGEAPGRNAVVVGAEHVSFSALLTLAHGGARATAMVTAHPRHQTFAAFRAGSAVRFRVPILTRSAVTAIHGRRRVEGVTVTDLDTGRVRALPCDLVVFTAEWVPDHEIAVLGGAELDPGTRGPAVDAALRTARAGVLAAGNLLHGAETADVAALTGRHVAAGVLRHLDGEPWPSSAVAIRCAEPLHWITPNVLRSSPSGDDGPPRGRFLLRAHRELIAPVVEISQGDRLLLRQRVPRVMPGRSARLPAGWAAEVDPRGGPVICRVARARHPQGAHRATRRERPA